MACSAFRNASVASCLAQLAKLEVKGDGGVGLKVGIVDNDVLPQKTEWERRTRNPAPTQDQVALSFGGGRWHKCCSCYQVRLCTKWRKRR